METTVARIEPQGFQPLTAADIRHQVNLIQEVMQSVMQKDQHYGVIPGCGNKPTLLKPGAEKLALTFRLAPAFEVIKTDLPNGHREYQVICTLTHSPSGTVVGQGVGCGSTMESKYRWRKGERVCPDCGKPSIIKGKSEYGGGWLCFPKKGGCGHKWPDGAKEIESQNADRSENPDIADTYNTVLKMAKKRAQIDATLTATAASDIFTQDIEDFVDTASGEVLHAEPAKPVANTATALVTDDQLRELDALITENEIPAATVAKWKTHFGVSEFIQLTEAQAGKLITSIKVHVKAKATAA